MATYKVKVVICVLVKGFLIKIFKKKRGERNAAGSLFRCSESILMQITENTELYVSTQAGFHSYV